MVERELDVAGWWWQQQRGVAQIEQQLFEPQLKRLVGNDEEMFGRAHGRPLLVGHDRMLRVEDLVKTQIANVSEFVWLRLVGHARRSKSSASRWRWGMAMWRPKGRM